MYSISITNYPSFFQFNFLQFFFFLFYFPNIINLKKQVEGEKYEKRTNKKKKKWELYFYIIIGIILAAEIFILVRQQGWLPLWVDKLPSPLIAQMEPSVREKRANFNIIDAHEHIQSLKDVPLILKYMKDCQIKKMLLLGAPDYTFSLNLKYGFTGIDGNNEEIIKISKEYPDNFIALCTIDPFDKDKLEKYIKDFILMIKL
jgi:hypothetical protein